MHWVLAASHERSPFRFPLFAAWEDGKRGEWRPTQSSAALDEEQVDTDPGPWVRRQCPFYDKGGNKAVVAISMSSSRTKARMRQSSNYGDRRWIG
jgi:hypothetical protein